MNIGYKTHLYVGATIEAITATVAFAAITSITPPGITVDEIDGTNMDQTDYVRRFGPGLIDPGTVQFEMEWNPSDATHDVIRTMIAGRETRYMEIRFDGLTPVVKFGGRGFFTEFTPSGPIDAKMTATATIRPSDGLWVEVV